MSAAAVKMVEDRLAEVNKEIEAKVGNLAVERDELTHDLKKLTRGAKGPGGEPATSDAQLIEAVGTLGGPSTSTQVAESLGVDVRSISRRLAKLASTGLISGDKEAGYTS